MQKKMTVVRIYLREGDPGHHSDLMEEILSVLHDDHRVQGVTVFRGISGFGQHGEIHSSNLLHPKIHLPLVIEFFDEAEAVDAAIEAIGDLVPDGHLLRWSMSCEVGPDGINF